MDISFSFSIGCSGGLSNVSLYLEAKLRLGVARRCLDAGKKIESGHLYENFCLPNLQRQKLPENMERTE